MSEIDTVGEGASQESPENQAVILLAEIWSRNGDCYRRARRCCYSFLWLQAAVAWMQLGHVYLVTGHSQLVAGHVYLVRDHVHLVTDHSHFVKAKFTWLEAMFS